MFIFLDHFLLDFKMLQMILQINSTFQTIFKKKKMEKETIRTPNWELIWRKLEDDDEKISSEV